MDIVPFAALPWPDFRLHGQLDRNLIVIGTRTPDTTLRDDARLRIRKALRETLGALLDCPPEAVPLIAERGHPPQLDLPTRRIGLSISHERGLTLAAIHMDGQVGIDLMRTPNQPNWMRDWEDVTRSYLGEQATRRISRLPPAQRPRAFAHAWTTFEASLKCLGLALTETNPALERRLSRCLIINLKLPEGLIGSVAI